MLTNFRRIHFQFSPLHLLAALLAVGIMGGFAATSHAEVVAFGDVDPDTDPDLPLFGSPLDGSDQPIPTDLITVGTGEDGIGRLVIDVPAFTLPLVSQGTNADTIGAIVGEGPSAIGEVVITGLGSEWEVRGTSIIGDQGLAFMSLLAGARFISTDADDGSGSPVADSAFLYLGYQSGSAAIVTVDGFGSRLQSTYLMVGREGDGSIIVTNRGNMVTIGDATIGVADPDFDPVSPFLSVSQPTGRVTVTGLGSRWTTQSSLTIGDDLTDTDEQGFGVLEISDQAIVQVGNYTTQSPFEEDELIINTNGRVELAGGTLRVQTGTSVTNQTPILNNGVIKGDGMIDGLLAILPEGELRNAASTANLREELIVTGLVDNFGTIESLGGEMEFLSEVVNNFEIVARDAVMRFPAGLENNGTITVGGNTTIHGPIDFGGGGDLLVMSDSATLVVGDLTFSAGNVLGLTVGPEAGTLDVTGAIDLGNATLSLDYSAGIFPQAGDTYQILSASDGIFGTFASPTATAGGGIWDITVDTNRVLATFTGLAPTPLGADFNGDGIVNGADLLIWQDNYGRTSPPDLSAFGDADGDGDVDGRDFLLIQSRWGLPGALVADLVSVPEPSSMVLLLSLVGGFAVRRKRS